MFKKFQNLELTSLKFWKCSKCFWWHKLERYYKISYFFSKYFPSVHKTIGWRIVREFGCFMFGNLSEAKIEAPVCVSKLMLNSYYSTVGISKSVWKCLNSHPIKKFIHTNITHSRIVMCFEFFQILVMYTLPSSKYNERFLSIMKR